MTEHPPRPLAKTSVHARKPTGKRCEAKRKDGGTCGGLALAGINPPRCRMHAGKSKQQIRVQQAVVMELSRWGLNGHSTMADAGEVLLRLVTQSAARCELYGGLLGRAYEAAKTGDSLDPLIESSGVAALIGYRYGVDREGNRFQQEEAIRGLAKLEAEERDRCANFAAKAVAAGLAERQVRMAEAQGMLMVGVIRNILDDLALTAEQQQRAGEIVARQLRAVAGMPNVIEGTTA